MSDLRKRLVFLALMLVLLMLSPLSVVAAAEQQGDSDSLEDNKLNELVNLARGKPVTIRQLDAQFDQIQGIGQYALETPLSQASMLTDGKYGDTSNWANTTDWFVHYRKLRREVIIDLGEIHTVNRISTGFGMRGDVGIGPPVNVRFYVSNDGEQYRYLGLSGPDTPLYFEYTLGTNDMHRKTYTLDRTLDGEELNVQARYVKLLFTINIFGWMDEIEVWGREGIADGAVIPEPRHDGLTYNEYATPGSASSAEIRDQFLWYSGPMADPYFTDWTKDKAKAFLAYLDIYGNIQDWFFDDILALPVTQIITPSGVGKFYTKDDMLAYLDFIFQEDTQLGAINSAAAEVNKALKTNRKVRVNMAIPFIEESADFGDIYGDGSVVSLRSEDFADQVDDPASYEGRLQMETLAFENKKAAVRWYIDEVERRFNEMGYNNLELNSFYWYHERIYEHLGEAEWIQATADYLKGKDYYFTWIPYIGPGSAVTWRDLGFTAAAIQPNFAFNNSKKAVFPAIADLAEQVGGTVEIEYDDYRTLAQYLNYGYELGYMEHAPNVYYLAAMPIVEGAYAYAPVSESRTVDSLSAIRRGVYDRIYQYVKDAYTPTFGMTLLTDTADLSNIGVNVMLPLADHFVEGNFRLHYDASAVQYNGFAVPGALQEKGEFTVTEVSPGVLNVQFQLFNPDDAIFADLQQARNPMTGAPTLITLQFSKQEGGESVNTRMFAVAGDGVMIDTNGRQYSHFSQTDLIADTPEAELADAFLSVRKAEQTKDKNDILQARLKVVKLPNSPVRKQWMDRLTEVTRDR